MTQGLKLTAKALTSLSLLFLFGCTDELDCGPDMIQVNGSCVPIEESDSGTIIDTMDTAQPDSGTINDELINGLMATMPICINEFVVNNDRSLEVDGESPDWIELHNPTSNDVSLAGWLISDSLDEPDKVALSKQLVVPAHGFLLLYADGDESLGPNHLDFKLNTEGEYIILTAPDDRQSQITYPELEEDVAAIRSTDCCHSKT